MKLFSGEVVRIVEEGSGLVIVSTVLVMVVRLRVSMIMLANPMTIVTMIPKERMPPVNVLY
jgi:hypothetical protein